MSKNKKQKPSEAKRIAQLENECARLKAQVKGFDDALKAAHHVGLREGSAEAKRNILEALGVFDV